MAQRSMLWTADGTTRHPQTGRPQEWDLTEWSATPGRLVLAVDDGAEYTGIGLDPAAAVQLRDALTEWLATQPQGAG